MGRITVDYETLPKICQDSHMLRMETVCNDLARCFIKRKAPSTIGRSCKLFAIPPTLSSLLPVTGGYRHGLPDRSSPYIIRRYTQLSGSVFQQCPYLLSACSSRVILQMKNPPASTIPGSLSVFVSSALSLSALLKYIGCLKF